MHPPGRGAVTGADPGCRVKQAATGSKPHRTHGISALMPTPRPEGSPVFTPFSLMLIGLACLALHLAGIGTGWRVRR